MPARPCIGNNHRPVNSSKSGHRSKHPKIMSIRVAFVGAGKMVSAIVKSLLRSEIFDPKEIACCSAQDGTSEKLSEETGILRFDTIEEMLDAGTDLLVLGCKPQQLGQLPSSISESTQGTLILSIMAGITLDRLGSVFPNEDTCKLEFFERS